MRPTLRLFLCGDVMTGRGIDQILEFPGNPELREPLVTDAREYVRLAEAADGFVRTPVNDSWPWGDLLSALDDLQPSARIINLETTITKAQSFAREKHIHYRMNPANIGCVTAIGPDVVALANNHLLDFGVPGLAETLNCLAAVCLRATGAGLDDEVAWQPAAVPFGAGRLLVADMAEPSSGVPSTWAAGPAQPGVAFLPDLSPESADRASQEIMRQRRPGDIAIASIHWGSNWGYEVHPGQKLFARRLIDLGIDLVHGHSSHHPRPVEVYRGRLILYGCGDLINDYEGIPGNEEFRPDLRMAYLPELDSGTGHLLRLDLIPLRARRMRLERATIADTQWLKATLERICGRSVHIGSDGILILEA